MSTHESDLFGPPGKLKLVDRNRPAGQCTKTVLYQRLGEFCLANLPGATPPIVEQFAKQAVEYVFEGVKRKQLYVIERTVPKPGRGRKVPSHITAESLLMSESLAAEEKARKRSRQ